MIRVTVVPAGPAQPPNFLTSACSPFHMLSLIRPPNAIVYGIAEEPGGASSSSEMAVFLCHRLESYLPDPFTNHHPK